MYISKIRQFLTPPIFEDEDKTRAAGLLNIILLTTMALNVVYSPILAVILPNPTPSLVADNILLLLQIGLLILMRRGYVQVASKLLLFLIWIYITVVLYTFGGVRSPVFNGYIFLVLMAGLLLGGRGVIAFTGLSVVSSLAILLAELGGVLPPSFVPLTPAYVWSGVFMVLIATAILLYLAFRSTENALERARRNEAHARKAQAQLVNAIESLTEAFAFYDADDRLVLCNSKYREFYDLSADLLVPGARFEDHIRTSAYRGQIAEAIGREETWVQERVKQHQNPQGVYLQQLGNGRWLQISERKTGEGGIVGVRTDITERVQAEEALRESEERFRLAFKNANIGVCLVDLDGRFMQVNNQLCQIFGYNREELESMTVNDIAHPEDLDISPRFIQRAASGEVEHTQFEKRYIHKQGHIVWGQVSSSLVRDVQGIPLYFISHIQDITELKRAEEALQASEEKYRTLFEYLPIPAFTKNYEGEYTSCNAENRKYWAVNPIGRTDAELLDHKTATALREVDLQVMETGAALAVEERLANTPLGERQVLSHKVPLRDGSGNIVGVLGASLDITEQKQLEEQLRQTQKMEAVGRLTAGIAHDFNNLLTAINGFATLIQNELASNDPIKDMIDKISNSGQRAADLVRQLMAFSRKQIVEPKLLNLNKVVNQIDKMLRHIIGEHIELRTTLSPELWPVKVDPVQFEQVIVNLAVNARDAMPDGGKLTIETSNVVLTENYVTRHFQAEAGEYVQLAISDTGIGISKKVQAHIFEPFFTTKEIGHGTGLGLATVYGIVKQSDGDIQVYSEEGQGTTFKIYLPRAEEENSSSQPHLEVPAQLPAGHETVLLVEDEEGIRNLASKVLQTQGYTVLEAQNGREALQLVADHNGPIHLLLTDVVMPELSGKALAKQLSQSHPDLKVLYMSGYTDEAIAHHGVLDSGTAFLQKPFTLTALARKVRQVLEDVP